MTQPSKLIYIHAWSMVASPFDAGNLPLWHLSIWQVLHVTFGRLATKARSYMVPARPKQPSPIVMSARAVKGVLGWRRAYTSTSTGTMAALAGSWSRSKGSAACAGSSRDEQPAAETEWFPGLCFKIRMRAQPQPKQGCYGSSIGCASCTPLTQRLCCKRRVCAQHMSTAELHQLTASQAHARMVPCTPRIWLLLFGVRLDLPQVSRSCSLTPISVSWSSALVGPTLLRFGRTYSTCLSGSNRRRAAACCSERRFCWGASVGALFRRLGF